MNQNKGERGHCSPVTCTNSLLTDSLPTEIYDFYFNPSVKTQQHKQVHVMPAVRPDILSLNILEIITG